MTRWPNIGLLCRTKNIFFNTIYLIYICIYIYIAQNAGYGIPWLQMQLHYLKYLYLGSTLGTFRIHYEGGVFLFFKGLEREFWLRLFLAYKFALQAILLNTVVIYTMYLILHN